MLGQFNFQKFVSSVKEGRLLQPSESSWLQGIGRRFSDKSLYALGFSSELLITPDDTLLVSLEAYGDNKVPRKKAVFLHKVNMHNCSNCIIFIVLMRIYAFKNSLFGIYLIVLAVSQSQFNGGGSLARPFC